MNSDAQSAPPSGEPRPSAGTMFAGTFSGWRDPAVQIRNADLLAVLVAVLLPWSTSGVAIGIGLWLIALVPTVDGRQLLRLLKDPICIFPIALFVLAIAGTSWSEAPAWPARLEA